MNQELKALLDRKVITKTLYNSLRVSKGCSKSALFYGLPKIHKPDVPLRPIVSHKGHPLYNTAKCLAQFLSPFSKIMRSHVENSSHLAEIVRNTTIEPDEVLVSFDVKSLFTSVPVKEAVECVKRILQADASWELQSPIPISTIIKLLTICLEDTTFKFREEFYQMTYAIDCSALGTGIATDRATRSVLPRANALDNAADYVLGMSWSVVILSSELGYLGATVSVLEARSDQNSRPLWRYEQDHEALAH